MEKVIYIGALIFIALFIVILIPKCIETGNYLYLLIPSFPLAGIIASWVLDKKNE